MESVPYAFCDAVCAVLAGLDALVELPPGNSNSGIWKAAAAAADDGRVTIQVDVNYTDGVWLHRIYKSDKKEGTNITFQELKAVSRRCVRTSSVGIGYSDEDSLIATLDEVKQILKYSALFANSAEMWIETDVEIPEDILTEFLVPFHNSTFSKIRVVSYSKAAEDFLRTQLQSEGLRRIWIGDEGRSDELRVTTERFALSQPFENVYVNNSLVFGLKFLKKLLRKSCRHENFTFAAGFRVKFQKLRKLKKKMQVQNDEIVWRRRDGVEVENLTFSRRLSFHPVQ